MTFLYFHVLIICCYIFLYLLLLSLASLQTRMSLDCLPVCAGSPPSPSTSQQQILSYLWAWLATAVCEVERPRLGFVEQAGQGLCFQWGMLPHKSCPVGCREVYPPPPQRCNCIKNIGRLTQMRDFSPQRCQGGQL